MQHSINITAKIGKQKVGSGMLNVRGSILGASSFFFGGGVS